MGRQITIFKAVISAARGLLLTSPCLAASYCTAAGVPAGCVGRPAVRATTPGAGAPGVGVTPGVGPVPLVSACDPRPVLAWVPMQAVRSIAPDDAESPAFCGSFIQPDHLSPASESRPTTTPPPAPSPGPAQNHPHGFATQAARPAPNDEQIVLKH